MYLRKQKKLLMETIQSIRPNTFTNFVGQAAIVEQLKTLVSAAKLRKAQLHHILFSGPPGVGKTTLAKILAEEMKSPLKLTLGPSFEKPIDLVSVLTQLEPNTILFIDEIHRIPRTFEEYLYTAMEDYALDILIEEKKKPVRLTLPPFTLIGATTRPGMLSSPLVDRFVLQCHLDLYTEEELIKIAQNNSKLKGLDIKEDGLKLIAKVSRGTPRILNNILYFASDYGLVNGITEFDATCISRILTSLNITADGLRKVDVNYLKYMNTHINEGVIGLEALATALNEATDTIDTIYEPFLVQQGYIIRTPQGRKLTQLGRDTAKLL